MKLTQEELDILENAPEGATHWMTHNYHDNDYAIFDVSAYKVASDTLKWFMMSEWTAVPLADLRKRKEQEDKQKIVDAVNRLKADLGNEKGHLRSMSYIVEFNQCVKEMSKHTVPADVFRNYLENKTPLEPKQKPVEWVYDEFGESFKMGESVIYNGKKGILVGMHNAAPLVSFTGVYSRVSGHGLSKPVTKEKRQVDIVVNEIMSLSYLKYNDALRVATNLQNKKMLKELDAGVCN